MSEPKHRRFIVTMGQAFQRSLPVLLKSHGARVTKVDPGLVEVDVWCFFGKPKTTLEVQELVWKEYPACSVGVRGR